MGAKISKCCRCKSKQKENENGVEAIVPNIEMYEETRIDEVSDTLGEPNLDFSFQLDRELDFHFNSMRSSSPQEINQLVLPKARGESCDPMSEDSGSFYDAEEYVQESTKKCEVKTLANSKNVTAKPLSDLEDSRTLSYKEIDKWSHSEDETKDLQSTDNDVTEQIGTKNHNALDSELTDEERDFNNTRLVLDCKYDIDLSEPETIGEKQTVGPTPNGSIIFTETIVSEHILLDQNAKTSTGSSDSGENVPSSRKNINEEESPILTEQMLHKDDNTKYSPILPIRTDDRCDDNLQKKIRTSADTESLKDISDTLLDQNATYRKSSSGSSDSGENVHILVPSSHKEVNGEELPVLHQDQSRKYSQILPTRIDDRFDDDLQKKARTTADTESLNEISHRNEDDGVLNHEADDDLKPNNAIITELKAIIKSINILEAEMESLDKQDTYQTLIKIMMQVNQVKNEDFDEEILHLQNKALNQINRCLRILK